MEKINVAEIAALARLSFTESEAEKMRFHMEKLTELFSVLNDIEGDDKDDIGSLCELREDVPDEFSESEKIIASAPASDGAYVVVPRVVSNGEEK